VTAAPTAERLLQAFATSDVDALAELCREDVVVYGTDAGERWSGLTALVPAITAMRELGLQARWAQAVVEGRGWVAGIALYTGAHMEAQEVRVTFAFDEETRLAHAHFSLEARLTGAPIAGTNHPTAR
jgi:hypothetical protein